MWNDWLFSSDDPNRRTIERFLLQLGLALLLAYLVEPSARLATFWLLAAVSAVANAVAASLNGEPLGDDRLNHWDAAAAFAALMLLAGAFMPHPEALDPARAGEAAEIARSAAGWR